MRYGFDELTALGCSVGFVNIFLDNVPVKNDIAFDPGEGYIEVYRLGPDNRAILHNENFIVDTVTGKVEAFLVRYSDGGWPHAVPEPDGPRVSVRSIRR
jgi:hypothetical protein